MSGRPLASSEIVWRETTAPTWTKARFVGKVTAYTFQGVSKDNYFFGVRAVDKQGRRSPGAEESVLVPADPPSQPATSSARVIAITKIVPTRCMWHRYPFRASVNG